MAIRHNEKRQVLIGESLLYLLIWSAVLLVPIMAPNMLGQKRVILENVFLSWQKVSPYLLLFIFNAILVPRTLFKKRYFTYFGTILSVIVLLFGLIEMHDCHFFEGLTAQERRLLPRKALFTDLRLTWNLFLATMMTLAGTLIRLLYKNIHDLHEMEALKQENLKAQVEYLKYQINPHFFMNTLNNIHALIDIDPDEAKTTVIELSKMMRYVLYDSEQQSISLEQDIHFMENYIRLMRIRYAEELDIRFDYPSGVGRVRIPPLIFIVFLENAFKHGIASLSAPFIHIGISLEGTRVKCTVRNSIGHPVQGDQSGIGLKNVKRRLELIYGENYHLEIRADQKSYFVELSIPQKYD